MKHHTHWLKYPAQWHDLFQLVSHVSFPQVVAEQGRHGLGWQINGSSHNCGPVWTIPKICRGTSSNKGKVWSFRECYGVFTRGWRWCIGPQHSFTTKHSGIFTEGSNNCTSTIHLRFGSRLKTPPGAKKLEEIDLVDFVDKKTFFLGGIDPCPYMSIHVYAKCLHPPPAEQTLAPV